MKLIKFFLGIVISSLFFLILIQNVSAQENCTNRFINFVNPVRGRNLWSDKTLKPLVDQHNTLDSKGFVGTWLLQFDALKDKEITSYLKTFTNNELGIFLEVSPDLALSSRVIYPHGLRWSDPSTVFLSGYTQSERVKLIDNLFKSFNKEFGYYPKSVGAWWIDSYSLNYMYSKYGIRSAMIVADQKTTDSYGVWGQPWGIPYYPSKQNILTPGSGKNILPVTIIQWAQRHPDLAYGEGAKYSNYSFQANDYIHQGLDTNFFKNLTKIYFDCTNSFAQITIGLETGMESVEFQKEYENQINYLSGINNISALTMSKFADKYNEINPNNFSNYTITGPNTKWVMSLFDRENVSLKDKIIYSPTVSFADSFVPDKNNFLDRRLSEIEIKNGRSQNIFVMVVFVSLFFLPLFLYRKRISLWFVVSTLLILFYGLLFKSRIESGWIIYFGPVVNNLYLYQIGLSTLVYLIFLLLPNNNWYLFIPLTYGLDYLLGLFRYGEYAGVRYFGITLDALRFVGIKIGNQIGLVNSDLSFVQASSLLKINFNKIYDNHLVYFIIFPIAHVVICAVIYFLIKKINKKMFSYCLVLLALALVLGYIYKMYTQDPRMVLPFIG